MIKKIALLLLSFTCFAALSRAQRPGVIAHRGHWDTEGAAQNSIASLKKAAAIKVYGAEFDVHLTADGVAIVHHDDVIEGLTVAETPYAELKRLQLKNGEPLPTLETYLKAGKEQKTTRLILEIKPHKSDAQEDRAVATVLAQVKEAGVAGITEYISFSLHICRELIRRAPGARVAYLRGDLAPAQLREMGFTGLDYHYKVLAAHPEWIREAHALGLTVNVWTVNDADMMRSLIAQKVDYITTDKPGLLQQLLQP